MALDCFQILEIPRQPWIDDAQLKDHFHRLAAIHHPDTSSGSTSAFSELNTAWQTLREPATCLRHFLSLEHPGVLAIAERTPTDLGDLFMEIADARQSAQSLIARRNAAATLARALMESERITLLSRLDKLAGEILTRIATSHAAIRTPGQPPEALAKILATLSFLEKWTAQLGETKTALSV